MFSNNSFATRRLRRYIQGALAGAALGVAIVATPAHALPYSNHTVTTTEDNGDAGSLRNTIDSVNLDTLHTIITFSSSLGSNPVFTLNSALPSITNSNGVILDTSRVGNVTLSQALTASAGGEIYLNGKDGTNGGDGDISGTSNGAGNGSNGDNGDSSSITADIILNDSSSFTINGGDGGSGGIGGYGGYNTTTDANGGTGGAGGQSNITGDITATNSNFTLNGGDGGTAGFGYAAGFGGVGDADGGAGGAGGYSNITGDITATNSNFTLNGGAGGAGLGGSVGGNGGGVGDANGGNGGAGGYSNITGTVTATNSNFTLNGGAGGAAGFGGEGGWGGFGGNGDANSGNGGAGGYSNITGDITATNSNFTLNGGAGGAASDGGAGGIAGNGDANGGNGGAGGESYIHGAVTANGNNSFTLNGGAGGAAGNGGFGSVDDYDELGGVAGFGDANGGNGGAGRDSYIQGAVTTNGNSTFILKGGAGGAAGNGGTGGNSDANGGNGGAGGNSYIQGNVTANDSSSIILYGIGAAGDNGNGGTVSGSGNANGGASGAAGTTYINGDVTANDESNITLRNDSSITGNVTINNNSYFDVVFDSSIHGNLIANNNSYFYIDVNSSVSGDVTFNDASVLVTSRNNTFNTTADTRTTFGANATFAPYLRLVQDGSSTFSSPDNPDTSSILTVNDLILNNSPLRPQWTDYGNIIPLNQTFDVLHYNGTRSDDFNPNVVSPFTFDINSGDGTNDDVILTLTGVDYTHVGGNENQQSLENYLNHFYSIESNGYGGAAAINLDPNSKLPFSLEELTSLLSYDGASDLNYLIYDGYSQHNTQTYWSQQAFINSIADNLRNGNNMGNGGAASFALNQTSAGGVGMQLASLRQAMTFAPGSLGISSDAGGNSSGVWAGYTGAHQHTDADSGIGSNDWSSSSDGFTLGYTGGGEKFSWGVAAGHQKSTFESEDSTGDQEGYNAGLYAAWKGKSTYLNAILGYGKYDNSVYGGSEANFQTHGLSAYLELGKRLKDDSKGGLSPYASLLWSRIKNGSASDPHTGFNLESGSNNIYTTALGLRYNHRMFDKDDTLKGGWTAGLAWVHQFGDTAFPVNGAYTSQVPYTFQIKSTPLSGDAAQVQLGAYGRIHRNLIGFAGYQGTFASNQKINAVNAGVGYQF